ncbi:unnamed protein product [Boreogadus saida]
MSRKKLAWANKEVETFVCILGEEDVVYDVYVAAAAIDIRPTTKVLFQVDEMDAVVHPGRSEQVLLDWNPLAGEVEVRASL